MFGCDLKVMAGLPAPGWLIVQYDPTLQEEPGFELRGEVLHVMARMYRAIQALPTMEARP
jgi:hypothetical protein